MPHSSTFVILLKFDNNVNCATASALIINDLFLGPACSEKHDNLRIGSCGKSFPGCSMKIGNPDENGIGEVYDPCTLLV